MTTFDYISDRLGEYYGSRIREHGATHWGADWNSRESQELRFDQLLKAAPVPDGQPLPVIDYGCGYGALVGYLDTCGVPFRYSGYDVCEEALAVARRTYGQRSDCTFTSSAADLEPADLTVASGIFNHRFDVSDEEYTAHVLETIDEMARLSRCALAFNMLTRYSDADRMRDDLYYGDPCFFFDYCKRNLSRHVALLHDYGLYEYTIIVRLERD